MFKTNNKQKIHFFSFFKYQEFFKLEIGFLIQPRTSKKMRYWMKFSTTNNLLCM